jgi:hypothetical protein
MLAGKKERGKYEEEASDDSFDILDYKQVRGKRTDNANRLSAGIDTFSMQFAEEKKSLKYKKECFNSKGVQFLWEKRTASLTKEFAKQVVENEWDLKY